MDGATILANARAVAPVLQEEAAANEQGRQLTKRAVATLRDTGVFRMPMPRAWGGPEVDLCTQISIIEELSAADASAGWCAMIGSDGGYYTAGLDDAVGRALYPDLDFVTAGFVQQPAGRLVEVDGGYRLSGRWPFTSGCTHADVIGGGALVFRDGEMVMTPTGQPEVRVALLPAERWEVLDTWHTTGLAGTGSHDVTLDDEFVPAEQTFTFADLGHDGRTGRDGRTGPLYHWPGMFFHNLVGVSLGIARAALEVAVEALDGKVLMPEMRPAQDEPRIRSAVARAHALAGSARSYTYDVFGEFWESLAAGDEPTLPQRAAIAGCSGHVTRSCSEAVALLADAVGTASIRRNFPLERHGRDLTTVSQHIINQPRLLEAAGGLWFDGTASENPLVTARVL